MSASVSAPVVPDLSSLNLTINEIFHSIQGESTFAGRPCLFIRLTACDLRCTYCDTEYAFYEGKKRRVSDLLAEALAHPCQLVEVTGGEPLLQKNVHPLMTALCDAGKTVLLETSGAHDIGLVDPRVHRIMDLKCPSSGESGRNLFANRPLLTARDEVKFVAGSEEDCHWALEQIRAGLKENGGDGWPERVASILFSPVFGKIDLRFLADTLLASKFPDIVAEKIRLQVQLHKLIWEPTAPGGLMPEEIPEPTPLPPTTLPSSEEKEKKSELDLEALLPMPKGKGLGQVADKWRLPPGPVNAFLIALSLVGMIILLPSLFHFIVSPVPDDATFSLFDFPLLLKLLVFLACLGFFCGAAGFRFTHWLATKITDLIFGTHDG